MSISNNSYVCAVLAAVLMPVMGVAAWGPTADSTTSSPKFTDGNFVISWNRNNKQLKYESHDASVSTVCDMSTLSEDVDAVVGYSHPTRADYPTKLEDVKVKARGSKFELVPSRVKESDVLGLSTEGSKGSPYYVVQWREAEPGMVILVR